MTESITDTLLPVHPTLSPLLLAMHDPVLHEFISYLAQKRQEQEASPETHLTLELSRETVAAVRESFRQSILDGERHLHLLSHLLASILLEGDFALHSNVIGVLPTDEQHPFHIKERINRQTLLSVTDIDLGNHVLDNFRYQNNGNWLPLQLSANFVEYIPDGRPVSRVNRLTSRVKAEEELWNKVADEIFALDELVSRDKHLQQYSKYVKDIFGIKIVCDNETDCELVHDRLQALNMDASTMPKLRELGLPATDGNGSLGPLLEFIETKDYLNCHPSKMKKTGWKALKSVVTWYSRLFEIQIQPLSNYYLELDHMAGPSHSSFKIKRDRLRDEITRVIPLYGFYRDLLKMIFMRTDVSFQYENATVIIK